MSSFKHRNWWNAIQPSFLYHKRAVRRQGHNIGTTRAATSIDYNRDLGVTLQFWTNGKQEGGDSVRVTLPIMKVNRTVSLSKSAASHAHKLQPANPFESKTENTPKIFKLDLDMNKDIKDYSRVNLLKLIKCECDPKLFELFRNFELSGEVPIHEQTPTKFMRGDPKKQKIYALWDCAYNNHENEMSDKDTRICIKHIWDEESQEDIVILEEGYQPDKGNKTSRT